MSAITASVPKTGHLTGFVTSSLVNLDAAPTVISSSYNDYGGIAKFYIAFTINATAAASAATSFNFTCDQISATFNNGTINAFGAGTAFDDKTSMHVVGVNSTSNISVSWITTTTTTLGQAQMEFHITRQ